MTLKALCNKHNGKRNKRGYEEIYMYELYEMVRTGGNGFLLPPDYKSCTHEWDILDSGVACCHWCGKKHHCISQDSCPIELSYEYQRVCTITGCIVSESEMRAERNAEERIGHVEMDVGISLKYKKGATCSVLMVYQGNTTDFYEMIHNTIKEIIDSPKTKQCYFQEISRNESKMTATLSKLFRDVLHDKRCKKPIIPNVFGEMFYLCRKNRIILQLERSEMDEMMAQCSKSIMNLLITHGGTRVIRHLQNSIRCREFICSMLYLMRMGITYQKRQLLPQIQLLNDILPLQALLPVVFKIRAKSITEGENIIKLDIRRMPM